MDRTIEQSREDCWRVFSVWVFASWEGKETWQSAFECTKEENILTADRNELQNYRKEYELAYELNKNRLLRSSGLIMEIS